MTNNPKDDNLNDDLENELGSDEVELKPHELDGVDDIVADEDSDTNNADLVKKLRARLRLATEEKQKYLNNWQRDKADFINAKKRGDEARKEFMKFAQEGLISELIPVLDSFEMAMGNKEAWEKADKNWRVGVEYIHSNLINVLNNRGLVKINPKGQHFDPKIHHSVGSVKTSKKEEDGVVLDVTSSGYSLNGKIIRAPQVKVGEFTD